MSIPLDHPAPPPLDEATARAHAAELRALAAERGITNLRFASAGRLVGHVDPDGDPEATVDFEIEGRLILGRHFFLFSDRVLVKPRVSPDLLTATPI